MNPLSYLVLGCGAFLCCLNFYLSFVRVPLLRRRGVPRDEIRNVTGVPLLGSLLVLSSSATYEVPSLWPLGIALILIDTGGPHWFAATTVAIAIRDRSRKS